MKEEFTITTGKEMNKFTQDIRNLIQDNIDDNLAEIKKMVSKSG
jgi:hypothetical protein